MAVADTKSEAEIRKAQALAMLESIAEPLAKACRVLGIVPGFPPSSDSSLIATIERVDFLDSLVREIGDEDLAPTLGDVDAADTLDKPLARVRQLRPVSDLPALVGLDADTEARR